MKERGCGGKTTQEGTEEEEEEEEGRSVGWRARGKKVCGE